MALDTNLSILLSAVLAITWSRLSKGTPEGVPAGVASGILAFRNMNQVVPTLLMFSAADSWFAVLDRGLTLGALGSEGWLVSGDVGLWRRWALLLALAIWRAEQLEDMLSRMQRSASVIHQTGLGDCFSNGLKDPMGWMWTPFWAFARRLALIAVSSFGCTAFVRKALPAVLLDEFLFWALAQFESLVAKVGVSLPPTFGIVILPLLDNAHFVPSILAIFSLVSEYTRMLPGGTPLMLAIAALAWTGHSCHKLYQTVFVEVPDSIKQLWAAWRTPA